MIYNTKTRIKAVIGSCLYFASSAHAFYAFEKVAIDLDSVTDDCSLVTSIDLVAYRCPDFFKIFHTADSLETPIEVYSTTKAVDQIKPSKLGGADPFISFIEAKNESDSVPNTYAYLKVIDSTGVRDLGISTTMLPNRSVYLGGNLIIRINEAETSLQVYDVQESAASSVSISINSDQLSYDYWTADSGSTWVIATCQADASSKPDCYFYTAEGRDVRPQSKN